MPYRYSPDKTFYVYIMASQRNGTLYTGMTSDIGKRCVEHANGMGGVFSSEHHTDILVYFEKHAMFATAKIREDRLKHWKRAWKIRLIEERNPTWMDLKAEAMATSGLG